MLENTQRLVSYCTSTLPQTEQEHMYCTMDSAPLVTNARRQVLFANSWKFHSTLFLGHASHGVILKVLG